MQTRCVLFSLALLLMASPALAGTVQVDGEGSPALYVVKVHADWCGSCKALTPVLEEVREALADDPVLFLELDVTDEARTAKPGCWPLPSASKTTSRPTTRRGWCCSSTPATMPC